MDQIVIENSKSGIPTIRAKQNYIHSSYNPEIEIQKFLLGKDLSKTGLCILFCPGLPYLENQVKKAVPTIRCISIHADQFFYNYAINHQGNPSEHWYDGLSLGLQEYLDSIISDVVASFTELIIWQPSFKVFPLFFDKYLPIIQQVLASKNSNFLTTAYFGKRWLKNIFLNITNIKSTYSIEYDRNLPIFIAGSGPSLNDCLNILRKHRNKFYLFALPSSIQFLAYYDIQPNFIISSDPGFWAGKHLEQIPQKWLENEKTQVFAPFSSNLRPLYKNKIPISLYFSDILIERIFKQNFPSTITLFECGTVAATAYELALKLGFKAIYSAGLDFANKDIYSHVRPQTFQYSINSNQSRLRPEYNSLYENTLGASKPAMPNWNIAPSLEIYSRWFFNRNYRVEVKTYDYNPSKSEKGLNSSNIETIEELLQNSINTSQENIKAIAKTSSLNCSDIIKSILKILDCKQANDYSLIEELCLFILPFEFRKYELSKIQGNLSESDSLLKKMISEVKDYLNNIESAKYL